MKIHIIKCDICGEEVKSDGHQNCRMPVVFLTEQTQGTPVQPYLDSVVVDICGNCFDKYMKNFPFTATGAMGNNTYKMQNVQNYEVIPIEWNIK